MLFNIVITNRMFALTFTSLLAFTSLADASYYRLRSKALIVSEVPVGAAVSCSLPSDLAKNFVLTIDNDTPTQGSNVTTTFDFDLDAPITGGTAYYSATLNGLGPFTSQAQLCDETAKANDPCPLETGHHHEVSVSQNTVTGKVVTTITWEDESGSQILCAKITTKSS